VGLFGKKLTADEQAELETITDSLSSMGSHLKESYDEFMSSIESLYTRCTPPAGWTGRSPKERSIITPPLVKPVGAEKLIEPAKRSADKYMETLSEAEVKLATMELPEWCKRKHRKAYKELQDFLHVHKVCLGSIVKSLSPPDALQVWTPEGTKLNMFVSGINQLYMFHPSNSLRSF